MQTAPDPAAPRFLTLAERISQTEARLVAREASIQRQWRGLMHTTRRAVEPRRLLLPLVGGAGALAVLWRLLRRGPGRPVAAATSQSQHSGSHGSASSHAGAIEALLMTMVPTLYPLLPARWRSRISPGMATTVLSLGLPLLRQLFARKHSGDAADAPPTASFVDLERYAGLWYEIARLPVVVEKPCDGQPTASYELRGDTVAVVNRCPGKTGGVLSSEGVARVVPNSGGSKLKVTFVPTWLRWLPLVWADYWILDRDEDYTLALVGTPSREALWLLARTPTIAPEAMEALVDRARVLGYDVSRLVVSAGR